MVEAIVLVQVKVGKSSAVAQAVGEIGGVSEAYVVTGPYDVIVRVEASFGPTNEVPPMIPLMNPAALIRPTRTAFRERRGCAAP